jgi:hypothetical protein
MKKRASILTLCLVALLWATPAPRSVRAQDWTDELSVYLDDYASDWFACWETAWDRTAECQNYPAGPDRDNCESDALSDKVTCLASSSTIFRSRASSIMYDYGEIGFCTKAHNMAAACSNLFQGIENTAAYNECRAASQVDYCE